MANRRIATGIEQRSSGSYRFTVALGMDNYGKQIRKTTTWKPPIGITVSKADKMAKAEYLKFKEECENNTSLNPHIRFRDLVEEYREMYIPNRLKASTARVYNNVIDVHLIDYFGNMRLSDIKKKTINSFFLSHKQLTNQHEEIPLTHTLAKRILTVLQSIFKFAVMQEYLSTSPCRDIILPKQNEVTERKRRSLSDQELPDFLSYFSEYRPENVMIKILLLTGIRSGELLGLKWSDLDFKEREMHINRTLSIVKGGFVLTSPKTVDSRRTISMNNSAVTLFKTHRKEQLKLRDLIPDDKSDMVFLSRSFNYQNQCNLNAYMKRILAGTPYSFMTLHCLRHTNVTLLLNNGVDLKVISEHLGHKDISTTADVYADVIRSTRIKTAELIEIAFAQGQ